ncbi:MAG: lasso peptide biosynthesis B2 protein [Terriglobales bacterium]
MSRLRKFLALPAGDQWLLMKAAGNLSWTSLGLRLLPFSYWRQRMGDATSAPAEQTPARPAERIAWAVGVAAGYVPGATCLVQALVARSMLERKGLAALVRIGVRGREASGLEAHAWLVLGDQIILGDSPGCPHVPLEKPVGGPQPTTGGIEASAESAHKPTATC